jgi:hypothetical protein
MFRLHPLEAVVRLCAHVLPISFACWASACLVDLDHRCGAHEHYDSDQAYCACDDGYAVTGNQCLPCGENEIGSADGCICKEGFDRATPDAACTELGDVQRSCETAADCPTNYGCDTRQSPALCVAPPDGLGLPCTSSDDCAGHTASYCETVSAHACLVNDCAPDPSKCHGDWVCCDIGLLTQSLCIPPGQLENGACPAGGSIVPRKD